MRLRHVFAVHLIDLAIIAFALFMVSGSVYRTSANFIADMTWILLIVLIVYGVVILVTEFLLLGIGGNDSWFFRLARTALTTGFVLWLFPTVLSIVLLVLGYQVGADVEQVLFFTIIIRTLVRAFLGRRWRTTNG